jgi:hypothetical protein
MATSPAADRYQLAAEIAARLYGARPLARWVPSEECDVFVLDFGGALPHKVIKLERPGSGVVAKEQRLLPFLRAHGLEVPVVEHAAAGEASAADEAVPASAAPAAPPVRYTVMAFVPSRALPEIYAEDPETARGLAARLGEFAGRLLTVPLEEVPLGWSVARSHAARLDWWEQRYAVLLAHPRRSARYERVFSLARALLERAPTCLGHGQGYQLLADGRGAFAVIDWAGAGASWPLRELVGAMSGVRTWRGDALATELVPAVLEGYAQRTGRRLTPAEQRELLVWEAYEPLLGAMFRHELGQSEKAQFLLARAEHVTRQARDIFG